MLIRARYLTLFLLLSLGACHSPKIGLDKDSAVEKFIAQNNGGAVEQAQDLGGRKSRRKLVQFRYGPKSMGHADFLSYLSRHESGPHTALLRQQDAAVPAGDSRAALNNRQLAPMLAREAERMHSELQPFGPLVKASSTWTLNQEVRLANVGLPQGLQALARRAGAQLQVSDKLKSSRARINGLYAGDLLSVLEKLSMQYEFGVRLDAHTGLLLAQTEAEETPSTGAWYNPFSSMAKDRVLQQELPKYHRALSLLQAGQADAFLAHVDRLQPPLGSPAARQAYQAVSRAREALDDMKRKQLAVSASLPKPSKDMRGYEPSADIMALGVSDEGICPGREMVTEKIFVYQESPQDVLTFLQDYFKTNPPSLAEPEASSERAPRPDAAGADLGKASPAAGKSPVPAAKPASAAATPAVTKTREDSEAVDSCKSAAPSGVKAIVDPTGIVVTGTLADIELAVRLMESLDIPRQQVFIEMYLVEVQKNWARTLETRLLRQDKVSAGVVSQLVNNTKAVAGIQATGTIRAASIDINAFINMVESNEVGRTISSPTLIAKNGSQAVISRTQTLRSEVDRPLPASVIGGISTPALPSKVIERLEMPLALKVKPTINQHNRHVTLDFEYEETTAVTNPTNLAASSTTKNLIKTTLETAPGDVIVMAGLYTEKNSSLTQGVPGSVMLGAMATLFGGKNANSASSSELLVFIRPTVLEPKAGVVQRNTLR